MFFIKKKPRIVDLELNFEDFTKYQEIKSFINQIKNEQVKIESTLISKILDHCEKEIEKITGISLE